MPDPPKISKQRPPVWLKDKMARRAWNEFSEWLVTAGILTAMDRPALELLAVTYAKWRQASAKASVDLYKTQTGYVAHNPMISVENRYAKQLVGLLAVFGMEPSSRSRLNLPMPADKEAEDPMEVILRAK